MKTIGYILWRLLLVIVIIFVVIFSIGCPLSVREKLYQDN